jgi:hypothetical protein
MNKAKSVSRRTIIKGGLAAGALLPLVDLLVRSAVAADAPDLDPADPTAKALGYVTKSAKPGQECSGCLQFVGKPGDAKGGCNIFPGKKVAGGGWCLSYVKKAGT